MPDPKNHPTGITALVTAAIVIVAQKLDLDLTAEEAAVFVGLAAAIVSWATPRFKRREL